MSKFLTSWILLLPGDMVVCVYKSQKARRYKVEFFAPSPLVCVGWVIQQNTVCYVSAARANKLRPASLSLFYSVFVFCSCFKRHR